jgi:hypothetical protein
LFSADWSNHHSARSEYTYKIEVIRIKEHSMDFTAWSPRYTLTPAIARGLMQIEAARIRVRAAHLPCSGGELSKIRENCIANPHCIYISRNVFTER